MGPSPEPIFTPLDQGVKTCFQKGDVWVFKVLDVRNRILQLAFLRGERPLKIEVDYPCEDLKQDFISKQSTLGEAINIFLDGDNTTDAEEILAHANLYAQALSNKFRITFEEDIVDGHLGEKYFRIIKREI